MNAVKGFAQVQKFMETFKHQTIPPPDHQYLCLFWGVLTVTLGELVEKSGRVESRGGYNVQTP
jgi:hypothetical protein